jgi:hypothetical protein
VFRDVEGEDEREPRIVSMIFCLPYVYLFEPTHIISEEKAKRQVREGDPSWITGKRIQTTGVQL